MTEGFAKVGLDPYRSEEPERGGVRGTIIPGRALVGTVPSSFQNGLFRNEIVIEFTRELCELLGSIMVEAESYKNGLGDPNVEDPSSLTKEAKQRRYQKFLSWLVDMRPSEFETRFQKFLKVNGDRPKRFYSMLINSFVAHVYKASSKSSHRHASIAPLDYPRLDAFVRFFLKNAAREQAIVFNTWPRCNPSDHLLITENAIRKTLYDDITNNLSVEYVVQEREDAKDKEERRARRRREREEKEKRDKPEEAKRALPATSSSSEAGRAREDDKKSEERRSVAKDRDEAKEDKDKDEAKEGKDKASTSSREAAKEKKTVETPVAIRNTARVNQPKSEVVVPRSTHTVRPATAKGESSVPKPPESKGRAGDFVAKEKERDDASKRSAAKTKEEAEPKGGDASSKVREANDASSKKISARVEEAKTAAPKELADPSDLQASPAAEGPRVETYQKGAVTFHIEVSPSPVVQKPPTPRTETTGYVRPVEIDDDASKRSRGSTSSKRRGRTFANPLEE